MYNSKIIKERINERRKSVGITNLETMLKELDIGKNTVWAMTDKKGIGCIALARIADRLDCSVDYLMGRTEDPKGYYTGDADNCHNDGITDKE